MKKFAIRHLTPEDHPHVAAKMDAWWGGRPVHGLLPRLFFEHFNSTSFAAGPRTEIQGFLVGFVSQTWQDLGYIHFAGVDPALRGKGLGRSLYESYFQAVTARGCNKVRCITSPVNKDSIEFHRRMGFTPLPGTGEIDGVSVTLDYAGAGQHRVIFERPI